MSATRWKELLLSSPPLSNIHLSNITEKEQNRADNASLQCHTAFSVSLADNSQFTLLPYKSAWKTAKRVNQVLRPLSAPFLLKIMDSQWAAVQRQQIEKWLALPNRLK